MDHTNKLAEKLEDYVEEPKKPTTADLKHIRNWAEKISGNWNGDESGLQEDQAHTANDIVTKVDQLQDLIWEMEEMGVTL